VKSRLLTFLSTLSLALFLAAFVLWIRGFWLCDTFIVARTVLDRDQALSRTVYLDSDCCGFGVIYRIQHDPLSTLTPEQLAMLKHLPPLNFNHGTNPTSRFTLLPGDRGGHLWNRVGFEYWDSNDIVEPPANTFDRTWTVPFWFVLLLFAALPARSVLVLTHHRRTRQRLVAGLCPTCGYDLRGSTERCPECGTPITLTSLLRSPP
jgi:hypothetical protein